MHGPMYIQKSNVQCHSQVSAHCGSQFGYQKDSFFPLPLFRRRLFDWLNVGFHSLDSAGTSSYARRRGGIVAKKKTPVMFVVRPSVWMYQLSFHWTDFYEIRYRRLLLKYIEGGGIQLELKSDKNIKHFTRTPNYVSFLFFCSSYIRAQIKAVGALESLKKLYILYSRNCSSIPTNSKELRVLHNVLRPWRSPILLLNGYRGIFTLHTKHLRLLDQSPSNNIEITNKLSVPPPFHASSWRV